MPWLFLLFIFVAIPECFARISVVTSTTDLAWAAAEIGREFALVTPLLSGTENPHYVDANPEFIRRVAAADIVCIVGMDLEIGWMPKVLARSGNAQVQPGGKGYCELGLGVRAALDLPVGKTDRSMGDTHPGGNPHFWLSPKALGEASSQIAFALKRVDPMHGVAYDKNLQALVKKLDRLLEQNRVQLSPFLKLPRPHVIEYHKEFAYFVEAYGIRSFGSIEEKPGVPPSAGRIAEIAQGAKNAGVKVALSGEYAPQKTMDRFSEISGIRTARVATSVQPGGKLNDYEKLQKHLVESLLNGVR